MSYKDGLAALNLEMPSRVPRTEYSLEMHWPLIKAVTGISLSNDSTQEEKEAGIKALWKAWNYDFIFNIAIYYESLGQYQTDMGHAVYAPEGVDYRPIGKELFSDVDDALAFDAMEALGQKDENELIERFNDQYNNACEFYPDGVNMTGVYITCISGMIAIFGWDMLLTAAGVDPEGFGRVVERYTQWMQQYFNALAKSKSPVVMIHDDMVWTAGAFIHPDWYRRYVFTSYKKLFAPLHEAGKKIMYISDGDYTQFIDDIAGCNINGFVLEPMTDMKYIAEKYGKTHSFIGNADTRILLRGNKEEIYNEVKRCMDIGKSCPGFFLAVGNHIPVNTPVESCLYYNEVYEKLSKR